MDLPWVVHGSNGRDGVTTTGPTFDAELKEGSVSRFEVTSEEAGLSDSSSEALLSGEVEENVAMMRAFLDGENGSLRNLVLLNSAAALVIAGHAKDLTTGVELLVRVIDDKSLTTLLKLFRVGPAKVDWDRVASECPSLFRLAMDIKENGLKEPIIHDQDGKIVDGVHRLFALWLLNYEGEIPTKEVNKR